MAKKVTRMCGWGTSSNSRAMGVLRGHEDMASCSPIISQLTRALRREGSEEAPPSYCSALTILRD